ncbi:hypothetical protein HN385_06540 [archaeon]|jgi:aminopeptidase|nr:hypothetical protein [archaeon]MBT3451137.1 hypothetical protein [archaeon]MBT6869541.1 hypothetical protein [archaeon]MBT7193706.1 hypothetical protein [archaeon]MBT7380397.1 hypothetical protein [archaeon]
MHYLTDTEIETVKKHSSCFYKVFKECLKTKKEEVLIITDQGPNEDNKIALMLAYGYYLASKKKKLEVQILVQDVKKGFMQADGHVIKAVKLLPEKSIIIVSVSNKLGRLGADKSFRKFCSDRGHRFVSSSGLGMVTNSHFNIFAEVINVNYKRLRKIGDKIKKQWDKANEIRVKTDAGTDLVFNVEGMEAVANVGYFFEPGKGGNVPAGEVYIAPKGIDNVSGKVVIDASIRHETGSKLLDEPVMFEIIDGRIEKILGKHAPILEDTFKKFENRSKYPDRIRRIGELGIGINPVAVLMGLAIMDEKVSGTAHIGVGSNAWFGGAIKTIFHGDMVFKNPQFFIDGKEMKY